MHRSTHWMTLVSVALGAVMALGVVAPVSPVFAAKPAAPKFYFRVGDVKAGPEVEAALKSFAGEAVQAELASRPEWASDVGVDAGKGDVEALVAELKKRNLRGFSVVVRFEHLKKDLKEPSPGARRKRLSLSVRLSVFGTTIPEEKLAFSGEGEAGLEAEVPDKGLEAETTSIAKDAIKDAIKQAVDQAVMKLSIGKAAPLNERKRSTKKK